MSFKRYFRSILSAMVTVTIVGGTLTSCKDDEPQIDVPELENNDVTEQPTQDIVETTVNANTAILASNLDEMSSFFLKRLNQGNVTLELNDDTELLIIDDASATKILKDDALFEKFEDFYYRGGLVYAHKPSMLTAGLLIRLYEGVYDGEPEVTIPLFDAWIFNIRGAQYCADDIHSTEPQTFEYEDEEGNMHTETITDTEKPSDYLYGRYAENAAKFVNRVVDGPLNTSSKVVSRGGAKYTEPVPIPMQFDSGKYKLYRKFDKKYGHITKGGLLEAYPILSITAEVTCAYSFDQNKDFYQIKLSETYPGSTVWQGTKRVKYKGDYYDKYGGFGLENLQVDVLIRKVKKGVNLESLTSVAPANQPANGTKETVSGFSVGGALGLSQGSFPLSFNGAYTSTTSISMPVSELPYKLILPNNKIDLSWIYNISNPLRYKARWGFNGSVSKYSEIMTKDFTIDQTWCWVFSNSDKQVEVPIELVPNFICTFSYGSASSSSSTNYQKNETWRISFYPTIKLPIPDRFKDKVTIVANPVSETSSTVRKLLCENSSAFRDFVDYPERAGITRIRLISNLGKEWDKVYEQVKRLQPIGGVKDEVTFYLQMSNGERVKFDSYSGYTGIHIDTRGNVSLAR